jgi:protein-disulfide isomerase
MTFQISGAALALSAALLVAGCHKQGSQAAGNQSANAPLPAAVPAPKGSDWSQTVAATPEGGFLMGNPNAKVKLVEFGSMSCSHCAAFATEGEPTLVEKYVKSGLVSYEFRNYVRDSLDLAASLLTRCGGPETFFPLTQQVFGAQPDFFAKLTPEAQQPIQQLPKEQQVAAIGRIAGVDQFVRMRGLPESKIQACLSDQGEAGKLVERTAAWTQQYNIPGTPTFLINGKVVENSADWKTLEPSLQAALAQ